jgi:RND family efflux transporter MFP subunit
MPLADVEKPRDPLASLRIPRSEPPRPSGYRVRRWLRRLVVLALLIGLASLGLFAASQSGLLNVAEALQPRQEVRVGSVSVVTGRAGDAVVKATGYLESRRQARIGARAPGRIETLNVEEGTRVHKGEVLAILEHEDLKAALAAANATLQRAQAEVVQHQVEIDRTQRKHEREERLRKSGASAESASDDARFLYEAAVAKLGVLQAAVSLAQAEALRAQQTTENMFIRAPFDGTVISKDAELGESILPGGMGEASGRGSVATIADLDHLEVECDVKEDYISRVRIGQPAEVAVDAVPDRRYTGKVRKIIPMGNRARATIKVQVEILDADEHLFPEMGSTVFFLPDDSADTAEKPDRRIYCPTDALVSDGEREYVWLVDREGRIEPADVRTGNANDGQTEVFEGLSGGERVILRPSPDLHAGQRVKVAE